MTDGYCLGELSEVVCWGNHAFCRGNISLLMAVSVERFFPERLRREVMGEKPGVGLRKVVGSE